MTDHSTWSDLCRHALDTVSFSKTPFDVKASLSQALDVDTSTPTGLSATILLQRVYRFAVDEGYTPLQISTFISIVHDVHKNSAEHALEMEASFDLLSDLLCKHSIHRPPFSVGVWNLKQLQKISSWMIEEYYEQYRLYQGICRPRLEIDLVTSEPGDIVEALPALPPLSDAITEEEYQNGKEQERQAELKKQEEEKATKAEMRVEQHLSELLPEMREAIEIYIENKIQKACHKSASSEEQGDVTSETNATSDHP